jgi:hypothetical protein
MSQRPSPSAPSLLGKPEGSVSRAYVHPLCPPPRHREWSVAAISTTEGLQSLAIGQIRGLLLTFPTKELTLTPFNNSTLIFFESIAP